MTDPRTLAGLVLTRAQAAPAYLAFDGFVPNAPTKGYVSLYFGAGAPYASRLVGTSDRLRWSFRAVCIGLGEQRGPDQCRFVVQRFRADFLNWRPLGPNGPWFTEAPDDAPLIQTGVENDIRFSLTLRYKLTT